MELYFVTSNQNKLREAEEILALPLKNTNIDLKEIQAIQVTEVSESKARDAYEKIGKPVVVEDTGLYIKSLSGFPGALIKWLVKSVGNEGVCRFVDTLPSRFAWTETSVSFYDGVEMRTFSGRMNGSITDKPRGNSGFGWDVIFQPKGSNKTLAEMTKEEKNKISHRSQAFRKLKQHIESK